MSSKHPAKLVAQSADINGDGNFPQGCSFSPDGLCVLTSTAADAKLRLYNTYTESMADTDEKVPEWNMALTSSGRDTVRSYAWYPNMKSTDPGSCCFLATCRDQPIHLFDAYTGAIRATYCPYNALDEMEAPTVVSFSSDGQRVMAAGFRSDRVIHVFDTATPGRDSTCLRLGKTRRSSDGQKGHVSALTFSSNERVFCVGTYSPGSIYVYDERTGQQPSATILNGVSVVGHGRASSRKKRHFTNMESPHDNENENDDNNEQGKDWFSAAKVRWFQTRAQGGITQLKFAPNEEYILYSASRRANTVISWDLRMISGNPEYQSNPIRGMGSFETDSDTNQRLEFDLDDTGKHLYVGGRDNCVRIYDVSSGNLEHTIDGLDDAANGVSICNHSSTQNNYLAVATGSRRFPSEEDFDNDAVPQASEQPPGFLSLYKV